MSSAAALAPLPPLAAALALLPEDLGERAMLGDAGANALGAMLGAAATVLPRPARVALLAGIAGLTAASEKVSFTKVIERTPALHWLDMLGRRPRPPPPAVVIPVPARAGHELRRYGPSGRRHRRDAAGRVTVRPWPSGGVLGNGAAGESAARRC